MRKLTIYIPCHQMASGGFHYFGVLKTYDIDAPLRAGKERERGSPSGKMPLCKSNREIERRKEGNGGVGVLCFFFFLNVFFSFSGILRDSLVKFLSFILHFIPNKIKIIIFISSNMILYFDFFLLLKFLMYIWLLTLYY